VALSSVTIGRAEGVPATQVEFVSRMSDWFSAQGQTCPDDSTIKKKLKPLWQRLRQEDTGCSTAVNGAR